MRHLPFVTAVAISCVAAFYSVVGLTEIFSSAKIAVGVMGSVLEIGKLVTASWLFRNWTIAPKLLKYYLTFSVVILMLITSMGIFGFLTRAYVGQESELRLANIQTTKIENDILREEKRIESYSKQMDSLDEAIDDLLERNMVTRSVELRDEQREERERILADTTAASNKIEQLYTEKDEIQQALISIESEIGPALYVSKLMFSETSSSSITTAVMLITFIIILVFDPLAVLLLIASSIKRKEEEPKKMPTNAKLMLGTKKKI